MWGRHSVLEMEETFKQRLERASSSDPGGRAVWQRRQLRRERPAGLCSSKLHGTGGLGRRRSLFNTGNATSAVPLPRSPGLQPLRQLSLTPLLIAKLRRGSQSRLEHMPMVGAFGRLPEPHDQLSKQTHTPKDIQGPNQETTFCSREVGIWSHPGVRCSLTPRGAGLRLRSQGPWSLAGVPQEL